MLRAIAAASRWTINVHRDYAREKRRINNVSDDYLLFKSDVWGLSDGEILGKIASQGSFDKWIDIADLAHIFHMASAAPVHVTLYDKKKYLAPLFEKLRQRLHSGEVEAYKSEEVKSIDSIYARPSDLWDLMLDLHLPDGGQNTFNVSSYHSHGVVNDEVPRPIRINAESHEEWLNLKTPFIYALYASHNCDDVVKTLPRYDRMQHGQISAETNNPYLA
jgi:hypothetical protein